MLLPYLTKSGEEYKITADAAGALDYLRVGSAKKTRNRAILDGIAKFNDFSDLAKVGLDHLDEDWDLTQYHEEREAFRERLSAQGLTGTTIKTRKRQRVRCSSDGEWSQDHAQSKKPFLRRKRGKEQARRLEIVADFVFGGHYSSQAITSYGTKCAALVAALSGLGYAVALSTEAKCCNWNKARRPELSNATLTRVLKVKESEQALDHQELAKTFSALFYRSAGFAMATAAADLAGTSGSRSISTPLRRLKDAEVIGDTIRVRFEDLNDSKLTKTIETIINGLAKS